MKQTDGWSQSFSFGGAKSIQIRVQDSVTTHFDRVDEFNVTGEKNVNRHRSSPGMKMTGRQARSTMSDMVFADDKHDIA